MEFQECTEFINSFIFLKLVIWSIQRLIDGRERTFDVISFHLFVFISELKYNFIYK